VSRNLPKSSEFGMQISHLQPSLHSRSTRLLPPLFDGFRLLPRSG
jgi:hypothetical protein